MAYTPAIPSRFGYSGNRIEAIKLVPMARVLLGEIHTSMRLAGPHVKTGQDVRKYADGTIISAYIRYGLSFAEIYVPKRKVKKIPQQPFCACCGDCLMIGVVTSPPAVDPLAPVYDQYKRIGIRACQEEGYIDIPDNGVPIIDGGVIGARFIDNAPDVSTGDRLLTFVNPPIKRLSTIASSTLLRTRIHGWDAHMWQVYDCMIDGVRASQDLRPNGIDNALYTISEAACDKAAGGPSGKLIQSEEEGPLDANLYTFVTSFYMDECWERV